MGSLLGLPSFYTDDAFQYAESSEMPTSKTPYILDLPSELIIRIFSHLSNQSTTDSRSDLIAFASTYSGIRATLLPMLFRECRIASPEKLCSMSLFPEQFLPHIQELRVHLDTSCINIGPAPSPPGGYYLRLPSLLPTNPHPTPPPDTNALKDLSGFLSRMSKYDLRHLSLSIAASTGTHSRQLTVTRIASSLTRNVPGAILTFRRLRTLVLAGFIDVGPILSLTPNITALKLHLPCPFGSLTPIQGLLLTALPNVPKIRSLSVYFTPDHDAEGSTTEREQVAHVDNLESAIKHGCPNLEALTVWDGSILGFNSSGRRDSI